MPKAYLITFRCYGTWLHGDQRGSVDRRFYNCFGAPKLAPNAETVERKRSLMKHPPYLLGVNERGIVEAAIREVCKIRGYGLFGIHVRTNHAHTVVGNGGKPERIMNSFKAYATKKLREAGRLEGNQIAWRRHGSTKYLWTDEHIIQAIEYVVNGQGKKLPRFS